MIKKSIIKIICLSLIIGLNWAGLLAIGETVAYFNDIENSDGNEFAAGSLDFSLTSTDFDKSIGLTETISLGSVLTNSGTIPFEYTIEIEKISGSDDFCNALELEAELNGIEKHDDDLMSFVSGPSTMLGTWIFEVKMPLSASNVSHGDVCEVDFVFHGWQTDFSSYPDGFSDEEKINVTFTAYMIVLNEFLPNPEGFEYGFNFGNDSDEMPQGEWVELYNNSENAFDLTNWYIWDASGAEVNKIAITSLNTDLSTTVIPVEGWMVVYMNKAVLNNTGDTVKLLDDTDTLIDSHTYTDNDYCDIEPTPGDENSTTTTGSCGGVPPNKSYARIPDGIGYWVDPIPTPGRMNRLDYVPFVQAGGGAAVLSPIQEENIVDIVEIMSESDSFEDIIEPEEDVIEDVIEEEITEELIDEPVEELVEEPISEEALNEEPLIDEELFINEEPIGEEVTTEENITEEDIFENIIDVVEETVEEILELDQENLDKEVIEEEIVEDVIVTDKANLIDVKEEPVVEEPVEEIIEEEQLVIEPEEIIIKEESDE